MDGSPARHRKGQNHLPSVMILEGWDLKLTDLFLVQIAAVRSPNTKSDRLSLF